MFTEIIQIEKRINKLIIIKGTTEAKKKKKNYSKLRIRKK